MQLSYTQIIGALDNLKVDKLNSLQQQFETDARALDKGSRTPDADSLRP